MRRYIRVALAAALVVSTIFALPTNPVAAAGPRSVIVDPANPMGDCKIDVSCTVATLRQAVDISNAHPGSTVSLSAATHTLSSTLVITAAGTRVVGWSDGEADSAASFVIDAAGRRAFRVSARDVRIRGVKIIGANAGTGDGAAVLLDPNVTGFELLNSEIVGRADTVTARNGAGISISTGAVATVRGSTFVDHRVDRKGGAIRVDGTLNLVNSTFTRNTAQSGGAISVAGTATISFTTFVDNTSNNAKGGGVDRNGGTVLITGSILTRANQQSTDGSDCSGNPDLIGVNYVGNAKGCNPGPSVLIGTDVGVLGLGLLGDYTGPTRTIALPDGSVAVDAIHVDECAEIGLGSTFGAAVAVDQRLVMRPQGTSAEPACDIGAYEVGDIDLGVALSSSTLTPFVGADFLPADQIAPNVLATDALFGGSLAASPLSAFPLEAAPLSAFPLSAFPLSAFPLSAFPLSAFTTAQAPLSAFPLSAFPLSAFPLSAFPLSDLVLTDSSWRELLEGTEFEGVPAQSLTLDDVDEIPAVARLNLADLNLEGTPLSAFPLSAFLLNSIPLSAFPLSAFDTAGGSVDNWCDLDFAADFCAAGGVDPSDPSFTLASLALAGVPLSAFPLSAFPLSAFPLSAFPLSAFPLSAFPLSAFQLEASPLSAFPLSAFPLSAFDADGPLVCGTGCDTTTGTLSDVTFTPNATLFDLAAAMLAACPAPVAGDLSTTAESCAPALGGFTLADLLAGLIPAGVVPWERLDLGVPGLQNAGDPDRWNFDYYVDLTLSEPAESVTVELALPARFAYVPGSATLDGTPIGEPALACLDPDSPDCLGGRTVATFTLADIRPGAHRLAIGARAGFRVQQGALAEVTAVATAGAATDEAFDTHLVDVLAPPDDGVVVIPSIGATCADVDGDVNLGWSAASSNDVHLYSFTVTQEAARCGLRADMFLSNLPIDFDLTLYGEMAPALRGPNTTAIPYLDDVILDLNPFDDVVQADTVQDIPQRLPDGVVDDPDRYGVVAVSSNRATEDERIRTGTLRPGTYYLQVSTYNGATSNEPYALRIRTDSSVNPLECSVLPAPVASPGELPAPDALADGVNTLFLVNEQLMEYSYGPAGLTTVLDNLARFDGDTAAAAEFGVIGAIIPVDGSAAVRDAYAARFADPCDPFASNDVVREIGAVIDDYTGAHPSIANIVIVGDDRQIPMANIVDDANFANERTFAQEFDTANESTAALAAGLYRSDDPYGTDAGIRARDHELFVPDRAVGRLVETPEEISAALDNFIDFGGRLDPDSTRTAFQSGYEFLEDGADLNATNLEDDLYVVDRLFGETWTDGDLVDALGTGLGAPYDVVGIHAHFDQANALPAFDNFNPSVTGPELFSTDELPAAVDRAVVYSMGCHSGWSASDIQIGVDTPDWAQALTGARTNVFAGNTGYGYGDTERVALTEQLTALFADEIAQDGAIGAAWVDAKQRMVRDILVLDAYQEKALQQFVLYGLPMFHVGSEPVDLRPSSQTAATEPVTASSTVTLDTDPTGQPIWTVDITRPLTDFVRNSANDPESGESVGSYFSLDDRTMNVNGHPIQPLHAEELPAANGLVARDALITQLSSVNLDEDFDPVFFQASPNFGGPRAEYFDGSFPAEMAAVRTSREDGSSVQQALFAAGQYKASEDDPDVGIQRLHPSIVADVYYADAGAADFTPPLIDRSEGLVDDDAALFRVAVDDTAERVYVLYRRESAIAWTGLDLVFDAGSGQWRGVGPIATGGQFMEYIVQAVDGSGNVAISNNKSQYFLGAATSVSNLELTVVDTPPTVNGWYTTDVTVEATNDGLSDISYRLGAGPFQAYDAEARITVDAAGEPGERLVTAIDTSGAFAALSVQVDAEPPTVALVTPVDWVRGPVSVEITADDGFGSGVDRILYSLDGGAPDTLYDDANRPSVTDEGVTVRAVAYDVAGNISNVADRAIRIDSSVPTAALNLVGPDASSEVAHGAVVTASPDCTDALSGIVGCVLTVDGVVYAGASPIELPSDRLGSVQVVVTATDAVGLTATDSASYTVIDRSPPVATVTVTGSPFGIGSNPSATYSCADDLTSITSCLLTVTDSTGAVLATDSTVDGAAATFDLPTALPAEPFAAYTVTVVATDAAGNTSSASDPGASTPYQMIDDVPPTPTLVSLSVTQTAVGDPVFATFSCVDEHSAIKTCELTVLGTDFSASAPGGVATEVELPTDTSGVFTVVVTATDVYGNQASTTDTYEYEVIDYLCVKELYDSTQAKKIGSNYTIKIEICDDAGNNISSRNIVLEAYAISDGAGTEYAPGPNDSGSANADFLFRYENSSKSYIYNLNTTGYTGPTGQTLTLDFTATENGTVIGIGRARFTLSP